MALYYILLVLSGLSLLSVGISAWFGMKAAKAEDQDQQLNRWLTALMVSCICLVVFTGTGFALEKLGVF
jgi:xanthine/uracil permease